MLNKLWETNGLWLCAAVVAVSTVAYLAGQIWVTRRIRRTGGYRASVLAGNPITGIRMFMRVTNAQLNNRLLAHFQSLFARSKPHSPNCVEVCLTPRHRFILTQEPEHIKTILTSKFTSYGKGNQFHELWSPFLGDSIFTTDGKLWQESRNLIRPMFTRERVADLVIFERWAQKLISKITERDGGEVDVMDLFYRMTLDVTTDFLLGQGVNSLENPEHDFAKAFNEVQKIQMLLTVLAPFEKLIPRKTYRSGISNIERFISPFIARTLALGPADVKKPSSSEGSFLHQLARLTRDPKIIRDQLIAVLLAGRDTTAATLSWCLYHLSVRPDVWARLRADVLNRVGKDDMPSYETLKQLKSLEHVISETLRMYPAVPFNVRTALKDTTLGSPGPGCPEIGVLEGDAVVYSTLAMQRRADIYPEGFGDPEVWEPKRWEGWGPKPWQYVPFNGGPRICVGLGFARTEIGFCLVRLLQRFERVEYRGEWDKQFLKAEIVGTPGLGVPVAFFEAKEE